MNARIHFSVPRLNIEGYAIIQPGEDGPEAVRRSIERRTGDRIYCWREDGRSPATTIYAATLVGPRCATGSYPVRAEANVYIDADNSRLFA